MNTEGAPIESAPDEDVVSGPKQYDLTNTAGLIDCITEVEDDAALRRLFGEHIANVLAKHSLSTYHVVILHDMHDSISSWHADRLYQAASEAESGKDILLIIQSTGGQIEPAYLISKTCKRLAAARFVCVVPRKAKSAATLLCLGADEIHMGLMSELGPIDPQIGGYPALALSNATNMVAEMTCQYPGSSEMFAKYLTGTLDLKMLGYFKRIGESAVQYAERLLGGREVPPPHNAASLASHFVNHYKDHGFVIDVDEASRLLGGVVKRDTPEYRAANEIYGLLAFVEMLLDVIRKKRLDYVGTIRNGLTIRERKRRGR